MAYSLLYLTSLLIQHILAIPNTVQVEWIGYIIDMKSDRKTQVCYVNDFFGVMKCI